MEYTVTGIRNKTNKEQTLTFDGGQFVFGPREVKILPDAVAQHGLRMAEIGHPMKDGKVQKDILGHRLFEGVPLEEAVKVAKPTENPSIVAAREAVARRAAEEAAMEERIMDRLTQKGWMPPKDSSRKEK